MLNGCYFNVRRADHWFEFADEFGTLTEGDFRGKPFRLLPWQAENSGRFFGWCQWSDEWQAEVRRFRMFYLEVSKKQGKTPYLSLIGNYLFFADCVKSNGEPRQINQYTTATTRKQAARLLEHSIRQIEHNDQLREVCKITKQEGFKTIEYGFNRWETIAANPSSADGVNGHCLADELHLWEGFEFYRALKWMLASQPEGVFAAITTAGIDGENVCKELHDYAIDVNAGRIIDETFFGRIYAASKDDDLSSEAIWKKANPSLGDTPDAPLKLSTFRADYNAARKDPTEWNYFKRVRLGIWATSSSGWIDSFPRGIDHWDAGPTARSRGDERVDCYQNYDDAFLQSIDARSRTLAFDLSSHRDTCAAVLSIEDQERVVWTRAWFWLPEAEAERQASQIGYLRWAQGGFITIMPGEVIDYARLEVEMQRIVEAFSVPQFYFDPMFQGEGFTQNLESNTGAERVAFPQTVMAYGPCVAHLERLILGRRIRHNGNAVLNWQLKNAHVVENVNGAKRFTKRARGERRKVDGAQALAMSLVNSCRGAEEYTGDGSESAFFL